MAFIFESCSPNMCGARSYERYNGPLNARLHSSKLSAQASLLQKAK
jgi:hypothetical protein